MAEYTCFSRLIETRVYSSVVVIFACPEHFLNHPDVGAVLQHQRRHRVAEQMASAHLADFRLRQIAAHQRCKLPALEGFAHVVQEHRAVFAAGEQLRARFRGCTSSIHASAAFADRDVRSFLPLPWRIITVPRSASMS